MKSTRLGAFLGALALLLALIAGSWPPTVSRAQNVSAPIITPIISTTAASGQSGVLALDGRFNNCSIIAGDTSTASITVYGNAQGSGPGASPIVNSNFGTSGVISVSGAALAVSPGNVANLPTGLYFTWASNGGTLVAWAICSTSIARSASGGGGGTAACPTPLSSSSVVCLQSANPPSEQVGSAAVDTLWAWTGGLNSNSNSISVCPNAVVESALCGNYIFGDDGGSVDVSQIGSLNQTGAQAFSGGPFSWLGASNQGFSVASAGTGSVAVSAGSAGADLFMNGSTGEVDFESGSGAAFNLEGAPLNLSGGSSHIHLQSGDISPSQAVCTDASSNASSCPSAGPQATPSPTAGTNVTITGSWPYIFSASGGGGISDASYDAVIEAESTLVAYYPSEETSGTTWTDVKGSNNGTYSGSPVFGGSLGNSLHGVNYPASASAIATLSSTLTGNFTIECLAVNYAAVNGNQSFCSNGLPSTGITGVQWISNSSNFKIFWGSGSSQNSFFLSPSFVLQQGTPMLFDLTYDGTNFRFYQNCMLFATQAESGAVGTGPAQTDGGGVGLVTVGKVALYSSALSNADICTHAIAAGFP